MYQIKNNYISIQVSNVGAQLKSLYSQVTDMEYLFGSTVKSTGLQQLDISNWKINPSTNTKDMFLNASNLTSLGLLNVDVDTINKI